MTTILDWQRAYFRDQADPRLRHTWPSIAVLMTYANRDLECFPSQATIAAAAGLKDPETVRRHLDRNIKAGWLQKPRTGGPGNGTNLYRFTIPSPLHSGDMPATEQGPLPAVEQPKLSIRTGHQSAQVTNQETSPPQGGETQEPSEAFFASGDMSFRDHERSSTAEPYPRPTAGMGWESALPVADPSRTHQPTSGPHTDPFADPVPCPEPESCSQARCSEARA